MNLDSVDDKPNAAAALARELGALQALAGRYGKLCPAGEPATDLRAAYVHGERLPWRLIETTPSTPGCRRRRWMLCFETAGEVRRCLDARLAWCCADKAFVDLHAPSVSGFKGISGDWVPSNGFADVFAVERENLRARIGRTPPRLTVVL